jgi:hypothetical protein
MSSITVTYRRVPHAPDFLVGDDGSAYRLVPLPRAPGPGPVRVFFGTMIVEARRLVLEAFVGPCPDGMEPVAIDGDPDRSDLAGVRWDYKKGVSLPLGSWKPRGSTNGRAKLDEVKVAEARLLRREGWSFVALGQRYGCRPHTVSYAVRGQTFKHIPLPNPQTTGPPLNPGVRRGEAQHNAKLTDRIVRDARRYFSEGWSLKALAERYGVTSQAMGKAIRGETFGHVRGAGEVAPPAAPPPGPRARRLGKQPAPVADPCPPSMPPVA